MNLERWQEIKSIVQDALDLPPEKQQAFLAAIPDEDLRHEAAALLAVSSDRTDVFDRVRFFPSPPVQELREGERIDDYSILRPLGEGGMGTVYLTTDTRHERLVALKLLFPAATRAASHEHTALARLTHPNIAALYDSGRAASGARYVVMEYVEGIPIGRFCERHCPTVERRLELFRTVCEAVEYAHRNLVVHRDLKPANILVTPDGTPKLLDFGIAKLLPAGNLDATVTRRGQRPLTLAFASPEQLDGGQTATATDIYSLGVLLCVLLTGRLPYRATNAHELPWAIRTLDPLKPSELLSLPAATNGHALPVGPAPPQGDPHKLRKRLSGDLDAIVEKALRKEPEARYRSVAELSEDIRRHLDHEPVAARKEDRRYRVMKFLRRNRTAVAAGALSVVLLSIFTAVLLGQYRQTMRERDNARREARRAEDVSGFLEDMFRVSNPWTNVGGTLSARDVLDDALLKLHSNPPADPAVRGTLLRSLGRIHLDLGLYAPAETLLEPALRDLEHSHIENPAVIARALADLAAARYNRGRFDEALRHARQALTFYEKSGTNSDLIRLHLLLGRLAFAHGEYSEAERAFRTATSLSTRMHGPNSLPTASTQNVLACALHAQGRHTDAAALYGRSLALRTQLLGEGHPATLQVRHNLACLYRDRGENARAVELLRDVQLGYRRISESNSPTVPALFHNLGSALISAGELEQADRLLYKSTSGHGKFLPDDHPDAAKTLAELGRLEDARGRYQEAETRYRTSLDLLEKRLGRTHPDTIAATHNFAILRAHQGKRDEAEAILRELVGRIAGRRVRPDVEAALRQNFALLARQSREPYRTVGIQMLDVSTRDYEPLPQVSPTSLSRATDSSPEKIIFFDDFSGTAIDPKKWVHGGHTVQQEDGELRIERSVTDHGGGARTAPIPVDPTRPLIISRRVKLHAANRYFNGSMAVGIPGYPEKSFGVSYANYYYTGAGETVTVGFSLYRHNASTNLYVDRRAKATHLIPPVWDRWFEEELRYDPRTGELRYFIDGAERLSYNAGPLPPNVSAVMLAFSTWGWYTGHYQYLDYLRVEQ